ncbi:MAG: RDD family protein [Candidatus Bathyarchaeia archaeon]|jgi:uncharacterized RDD family membrane protein YckC
MTTSSSSAQTSGQIDFSLWLIRLVAYIIDTIIITVVTFILFIFLPIGIWGIFGLFGLLSILYFIILDVVWGATIGKKVMGLKVETVKDAKITFVQSFIRNISKFDPLFVFIDWLIAIATNGPDKRQKLTDRWAGTTVVQAGKAPITLI